MILCISQLIVAQYFLKNSNASFFERELLLSGSLYGFVFSQLITSGFIMVITRYVADQIYQREEQNILSSLYGIMAVILIIGGFIGFVFYLFSPLNFLVKMIGYLFFTELLIVNILTMYISAINIYFKIVKSYIIGILISMAAMWVCSLASQELTAVYLLACMSFGFFIIILLLMKSIKNSFPVCNQNYFGFLPYISRYPSLFFIGLFYTLGLFGHIFMFWGSELKTVVGNTFVIAPLYDVSVFYAYLSILPAMIKFVVSVETSFYKEYKNYYSKVLGTSSIQEIAEAKSDMFHVLKRELVFIMEVQLFFTIIAIPLGTTLLPLTIQQVDIFNILVIANYYFIIMFVIIQILLYFDDRKGALLVLASYLAVSLPVTVITIVYEGYYGVSCFIAGLIGLSVAIARLYHYGKNLEYYTYCMQPTILKRKKGFFERMAYKLNSINGAVKEK